VNEATGTPKPVISDATIKELAKKFVEKGDKSGVYAIANMLQQVSEKFFDLKTPDGAAAAWQVSKANEAFAHAWADRVYAMKRQRSDAAPLAPAGYATV
jgi:4-hydroxyphenylpyruvate dioxygenase-like putative hemolysin